MLGALAVVGKAWKILRSNTKLVVALTLTLILPHSLAILGYNLVSEDDLFNNMISWGETGSPAGERTQISWEWMKLCVFLAAYEIFVLAFSLLSAAAVVYTVASIIYSGKEVTYTKAISVVPTVWKRLMVTFLWFFVIVVYSYAASVSAIFLLIYAAGVDKPNSGVFLLGLILLIGVCFCLYVYINMVWHLACVISVLEDKYGRDALSKSNDLIKGKQITALALVMVYLIFGGVIEGLFGYAVVDGRGHSVALRAVYGTLLVGLLCFLHLMGLLTQSLFYFVCKSYHHESIDNSPLGASVSPKKSSII